VDQIVELLGTMSSALTIDEITAALMDDLLAGAAAKDDVAVVAVERVDG
jgi:hypothetical protein